MREVYREKELGWRGERYREKETLITGKEREIVMVKRESERGVNRERVWMERERYIEL